MDAKILSRLQFALTIAFHYIYRPLSIGLGLVMVIMEGLYLRTGGKAYEDMARFWTRIFAFALESGFLGVLLFGWNRVKPRVHFIATTGVFFGSLFSAVWIVVANSWQQTPAGYHIVGEGLDARAEITDFWAMVFNPSSVDRLLHVWIGAFLAGAFLAGAFLVMSVHAFYLLRGRYVELSRKALKISLMVATIFALAQLVTGHQSADGVAENQPAKLAFFEGHFEEEAPGDLYLLGWVDKETQEVKGIKLPGGLSFLVHWDAEEPVAGLNAFAEDERPGALNAIFQFYHIMVAIGLLLFLYLMDRKIQKGPYEESDIDNRMQLKDIAEQFEKSK